MKKVLYVALVVMALLAFSTAAFAERMRISRETGQGMKWWENSRITKNIGLSDEQTEKIEKIFNEAALKRIDMKAQLQKENLKLREMLDEKVLDMQKIEKQIDTVLNVLTQLKKGEMMTKVKVMSILTPEQREKLRESFQAAKRARYIHRGRKPSAPVAPWKKGPPARR